jgi:uncharacterized membrane protein
MEAALVAVTNYVALAIDFIAFLVIAFGSVEAFVAVVRGLAAPGPVAGEERRAVWLRYARWLVAGLTFQLAADIVGTAIAPTWDEIGRLGAIAVIRTFLNYFLERDIGQVRERQVARLDSAKETS